MILSRQYLGELVTLTGIKYTKTSQMYSTEIYVHEDGEQLTFLTSLTSANEEICFVDVGNTSSSRRVTYLTKNAERRGKHVARNCSFDGSYVVEWDVSDSLVIG